MSFDRHLGKDHRKPYYRRGKYDRTCRPNGSCPYCRGSRLHSQQKQITSADEQIREDLSAYVAGELEGLDPYGDA